MLMTTYPLHFSVAAYYFHGRQQINMLLALWRLGRGRSWTQKFSLGGEDEAVAVHRDLLCNQVQLAAAGLHPNVHYCIPLAASAGNPGNDAIPITIAMWRKITNRRSVSSRKSFSLCLSSIHTCTTVSNTRKVSWTPALSGSSLSHPLDSRSASLQWSPCSEAQGAYHIRNAWIWHGKTFKA